MADLVICERPQHQGPRIQLSILAHGANTDPTLLFLKSTDDGEKALVHDSVNGGPFRPLPAPLQHVWPFALLDRAAPGNDGRTGADGAGLGPSSAFVPFRACPMPCTVPRWICAANISGSSVAPK